MIPKIDPEVKYVGSSYLRTLKSDTLREFKGAVVVQDGDSEPLVVIVPYLTYLNLQNAATRAEKWATLVNRQTGEREFTIELDGDGK